MAIDNDSEFKAALGSLPRAAQRRIAARFAKSVLALSQDHRIKGAIEAAKRSDITDDEYAAAMRLSKAASVDSYTQCGHDCDWNKQASHFVAEAALVCFRPGEPGDNFAWDAAMHARMARSCETIATGLGTDNAEAEAQYRILAEFLNA
jgi:hypothetical protein